jgi:hypothetical protein
MTTDQTAQSDDIRKDIADLKANRHLALYLKHGNGLLIWRAYIEYRKLELPIPENILNHLDLFANRLLSARGQSEIAAAVEMTTTKKTGRGGGPQGRSLLTGQEHSRDIVEAFHIRRQVNNDALNKLDIKTLAAEVGKQFGISGDEVQTRYSQWISDPESVTEKPANKVDIQDLVSIFSKPG